MLRTKDLAGASHTIVLKETLYNLLSTFKPFSVNVLASSINLFKKMLLFAGFSRPH